jgi:hypothetical protein
MVYKYPLLSIVSAVVNAIIYWLDLHLPVHSSMSVYQHLSCEVNSYSWRGVLDTNLRTRLVSALGSTYRLISAVKVCLALLTNAVRA